MSGIAKVLISRKFSVSGSDVLDNDQTKKLCSNGAIIFNNQNQKNIDVILEKFPNKRIIAVISSAIKANNICLLYTSPSPRDPT